MNTASVFQGKGTCLGADGVPSFFVSLDTLPFGFPFFHLLTTSLGLWTSDAVYPGKEAAFVDEGVFAYHDSCAVVQGVSSGNSIDFLYGGSTRGGYAVAATAAAPLTKSFVDLASNFSASLPGPVVPPFTGSVRPTRHMVYVNVP